MSIRLEKILAVFSSLTICVAVIAWSFVLNFGKLEITTNQPFVLEGVGKKTISCEKNCTIKVPIGEFIGTFQANGFKNINANIVIKRLRTTQANLEFEYKPVLIVGELIKKQNIPKPPANLEKFNLVWDKYDQNALYLKKNGTQTVLMLWKNAEQKMSKITNFYKFEIQKLFWSNQGKQCIAETNDAFFLIDLEKKMKKSLALSVKSNNLSFSPNDSKLLVQAQNPIVFDLQTQKTQTLNMETIASGWKDEKTLLYAINKENRTELYTYDLEKEKQTMLFALEEILIPQNLRMSANQKSVEFETTEKSYELKLVK